MENIENLADRIKSFGLQIAGLIHSFMVFVSQYLGPEVLSPGSQIGGFVSVLIGLDTAILTIAIPLMAERQIKIQEIYQSNILSEIISKDRLLNYYWVWVFIHFTIGSITLLFISNRKFILENGLSDYVSLLLEFLFLGSILIIYFLTSYIKKFSRFESNPLAECKKYKKAAYKEEECFLDYLELVFDITLAKTQFSGKNRQLKENIEVIFSFFKGMSEGKFNFIAEVNYEDKIRPVEKLVLIYKRLSESGNTNPELAKYIIKTLEKTLKISCSKENNHRIVKYILSRFYVLVTHSAAWHEKISKRIIIDEDNRLGNLCYQWYFGTTFDWECKEEYVKLLNNAIFRVAQYLIDNDILSIFKKFLSFAIEGELNSLAEISDINLRREEFREAFILIAAYSIFAKKFSFLEEILYHEDTEEGECISFSSNLLLEKIEEIIPYFNKEWLPDRLFLFGKNHGIRAYLEQYLIILLLKALRLKISSSNFLQEKDKILEGLKQADINLKGLMALKEKFRLKEGKNQYLSIIETIFSNRDLLDLIRIESEQEEKIKRELYELCDNIANIMQQKEDKIIQETRIPTASKQEFIRNLIEAYNKFDQVGTILKHLKLFEEKADSKQQKSIEEVSVVKAKIGKDTFFKDQSMDFIDSPENLGRRIAQRQTNELISALSAKCAMISLDEMQEKLNNIVDKTEIAILFNNYTPSTQDKIAGLEFVKKWGIDRQSSLGYIKFDGANIPVFYIQTTLKSKNIIILNCKRFGKLQQHLQNNLAEGEQTPIEVEIREGDELSHKIQDQLREEILPATESEIISKESLLNNVLIKVGIKSELVVKEDFEGYIVNLST